MGRSVSSRRTAVIDVTAGGFLGNPGGLILVDPVTMEVLETPVLVPEPVRKYRALQLVFQSRLRENWQLAGSYVYSKNEGYVGLYKQDLGQLAPDLTADFDLPELANNATGPLPNDRTHQVKLYGSYQWSFGLTTGLVAQYLSGTAISKIGYRSDTRHENQR